MHRCLLAFLAVFFLNAEVIFGGKCEIVRFAKEKNVARKCCLLNKNVDEKNIIRFQQQGYVVVQDDRGTLICRNIEEGEEAGTPTGHEGTKGKKVPNIEVYQIIDSSKRCPDDQVVDFQGNCVDPFK